MILKIISGYSLLEELTRMNVYFFQENKIILFYYENNNSIDCFK